MTWHRALLLALVLVGIGSVPGDAVDLHVGTGRALLSGDGNTFNGVKCPCFFVDAITGAGSDAASGASSTVPWATLAHADSTLAANASNLLIKYPDGVYRSAPPVWHGFLSYWSMIRPTFPGAVVTTLYDIFNGHNCAVQQSSLLVGGGVVSGNNIFSAGQLPQCANWASFASTASGAFIVAQYNFGNAGTAFFIGDTARWGGFAPFSDTHTDFDFGNFTTGRISYTPTTTANQINIWGFLAGGNYQAIYQNAIRQATQASNPTYTPDAANTLVFGGGTNVYTQIQFGAMVTLNTLADADYLAIQNWFTVRELPRISSFYTARLPTLQPTSPLVTVPPNGLELVPAMGWDSWRVYGSNVTEAETKANALAMTTNGMQAAGYQYVEPSDGAGWFRNTSNSIVPNSTAFPAGMAALGTYIHGLGLKYGFYGAPLLLGCNAFPGSGTYENIDAAQWASFGVDRIMVDNCSQFSGNASAQYGYQALAQALQASGRPIDFLCSTPVYGNFNSAAWATSAGCNEVWTAPDTGNMTFATMMSTLDLQFGLEVLTAPGRFNMPDFLGVGNANLTDIEGQTNLSLWAVLAAPLMTSINLTTPPSANTLATLTNSDVIAVDQDASAIGGKRVSRTACGSANCEVYARQLSGGAWAIVLLNRASTSQSISATWASFGQSGTFDGRDLWAHTDLGSLTGYTTTVASHGIAMLRLTPTNDLLLADGSSYMLLANATNKLCLTGGC